MQRFAAFAFCFVLSPSAWLGGCSAAAPMTGVAGGEPAGETGEPAASDTGAVPDAAVPTGRLVQITVVSAEIAGNMANGEQWDTSQGQGRTPEILQRWLDLHPELADTADTVGVPVDQEDLAERAKKSPAADPMVLMEVGGAVVRSPVQPRAFNPLWDFSWQFLYGELGGRKGVEPGAMMRIHVVDYDGPGQFDAIGSMVIAVDELLRAPVHELGPFGGVTKLTLQAHVLGAPADPDGTTSVRVAVSGKPSWTDTGIDLVAGQRVWISAADEICTGSGEASCNGPEGQRTPHDANLPGFARMGHGALVAALGDTRFVVRRDLRFVAPATGRLRLGVNDRDTGNNRGSFAVNIVVHALP